jgi:hypothetical protein
LRSRKALSAFALLLLLLLLLPLPVPLPLLLHRRQAFRRTVKQNRNVM